MNCQPDLVWAYDAGVEVGVAGAGLYGVLLKVFADVFCCGLRQQPIQTLPGERAQDLKLNDFLTGKGLFELMTNNMAGKGALT